MNTEEISMNYGGGEKDFFSAPQPRKRNLCISHSEYQKDVNDERTYGSGGGDGAEGYSRESIEYK